MKYSSIENVKGLSAQETAEQLMNVREKLRELRQVERFLTVSVVEGMEEIGATKLRTEKGIVQKMVPVSDYDLGTLAKLREITSPEDLEGVYIPEHTELVPEKWDGRRLKKVRAFGNEHAAIIDDAEIRGNPRIILVEEKGTG